MTRNSKTPFPKLCVECKHSKPDLGNSNELRCMHPWVNALDPWALSRAQIRGSETAHERSKRGIFGGMCGMRGRLWEPREQSTDKYTPTF